MSILYLLYFYIYLWLIKTFKSKPKFSYKTHHKPKTTKAFKSNKKPQWIVDKIIYFKAMMPKTSGYKIADTFNRQFSHLDTVSKTYVYNIIRKHHYAILIERKNIKNKKPHSVDVNWVWAIDLTGKHDSNKCNQHILGIIDHGSRFNITLKYIDDKSSKRLLFEIYHAVKKHGKPKFIRTDNDIVFKSNVFKLGLKLMGIKHQTTDISCPWQKNIWNIFSCKPSWTRVSIRTIRIKWVMILMNHFERFFGTLKRKFSLQSNSLIGYIVLYSICYA